MYSLRSTIYQSTLEKRNRELTILNQIAEALNREVNLQQAIQSALQLVVQLFDLETGWLFLMNEASNDFYVAATQNLPPALADHPRRMTGWCYCLETFEEGDMSGAANINAITCTRLKNLKEGTDGLLYHASIPLYAHTKQLGVLNVASTNWDELSKDDLRLLHTIGDLMSMAIERARLFEKSREIGAINERNRLAREIHDTIAQGLAGIALQLESADAMLESDVESKRVQEVIQKALAITRENMEEARRSVLDLRAAPLEGRTLPEALRSLLNDPELKSSLQTHNEIMGTSAPLPMRIAVGLYRIAQEAITNVRKHANATRMSVKLDVQPDYARLIIEDNGDGFDTNEIPDGHFGLIGLRERVKLLHGQLDVCSTPNVGTTITVHIPLEENHG